MIYKLFPLKKSQTLVLPEARKCNNYKRVTFVIELIMYVILRTHTGLNHNFVHTHTKTRSLWNM